MVVVMVIFEMCVCVWVPTSVDCVSNDFPPPLSHTHTCTGEAAMSERNPSIDERQSLALPVRRESKEGAKQRNVQGQTPTRAYTHSHTLTLYLSE